MLFFHPGLETADKAAVVGSAGSPSEVEASLHWLPQLSQVVSLLR